MERKKELRKDIAFIKTQQASLDTRKSESANVLQAIENNTVFQQAKTVLLYYSLNDEVDTHEFVEKWSSEKRVLLPVVIGDKLILRIYSNFADMESGPFGICEPTGKEFTDYDEIDFIAVPGVAFDRQGHRLGRGKGYYDKLLPQMPKAYKAGICFSFQLVENVPTDEYDVCMDTIITSNEDKLSHTHLSLPPCDGE